MKRRGSQPLRFSADWVVRGSLAVLAILLLCLSVSQALGDALKGRNPTLAHALAPWNGQITAVYSRVLFKPGQTGGDRPAIRMAQRALRQDPTALSAISVLGFEAEFDGNKAKARRLFAYAQFLSRRDLQTQLWMVEDAVGRGDVAAVLHHYDIALRTSKSAPDLMFPVLASAMADTSVMAQLITTLVKRPAWEPDFVTYVARNTNDPVIATKLYVGLQRVGITVPFDVTATIIERLGEQGNYNAAWRYYSLIHSGADAKVSRDPKFAVAPSEPSLFDWKPVNDAAISTSIQKRQGRGGVFDFAIPPSVGGVLLRQVQMLVPGTYRLNGRSVGITQPEKSLPYWTLLCHDGRELGRVALTQNEGDFSGQFIVPVGCSPQTLALIARASDDIGGVSGQIESAKLSPNG